jgi:dTMP kinase
MPSRSSSDTISALASFIVIEGGDGAGKSRLQAALGERITSSGRECVLTREPGGTPLGESIRDLVLAQAGVGDPVSELLLFEAARAHLVGTVIRPALERGAIVVCDRFAASSTAYQGYGRGLGRELVERANTIATGGLAPDLTLLLDLPVEAGLARRAKDGGSNHFDAEALAFHERVRAGFLELARDGGDAWIVIDASQEFDGVMTDATTAVDALLKGATTDPAQIER